MALHDPIALARWKRRRSIVFSAGAWLPVCVLQLDHDHSCNGFVDGLDLVRLGLVPANLPDLGSAGGDPAILVRHSSGEFAQEDVEMSRMIVAPSTAWTE